MEEDERKRLLFPPWSVRNNGPKYDDLGDDSQQVWRTTRGQKEATADTVSNWLDELASALAREVITPDEAQQAINREVGDEWD